VGLNSLKSLNLTNFYPNNNNNDKVKSKPFRVKILLFSHGMTTLAAAQVFVVAKWLDGPLGENFYSSSAAATYDR
jgi:hypothetical protein